MKKFAIYNASAGSGKTFTLVKEYLKIALATDDPNAYQRILAITFTNKAASEMKERVLDALKSFSGLTPMQASAEHLMDALVLPVENDGIGVSKQVLQQRSEKTLKSILHNYTSFAIGTIDKFTHKIVRTFAHDLHLPLNFDIEMDQQEVISRSVDLLINEVGVNEKTTKLLVEYAKSKSQDEKSWNIEKDVKEFAKEIAKEDAEQHLKKIRKLKLSDFEKIKADFVQARKEFEDEIKKRGEQMLDKITANGIDFKSFSRSYFPSYCQYLKNGRMDKLQPTSMTQKMLDGNASWYAKSVASDQKGLIDGLENEIHEWYSELQAFIGSDYTNYVVAGLVNENIYSLALLNEIEQNVDEYKLENNVLDFSDFNKKIAKVVEQQAIPFIYERLGERYHHYLIDEFQDTSVLQWHNLIPLVENSLSEAKFSMVVGDAKQAIYRFRGGEVEQLIKLPQIYRKEQSSYLQEREAIFERNHFHKDLTTNYRSKKEVVEFNNQFFDFASSKLSGDYQSLFKGLNQLPLQDNTGGGVQIRFLEDANKEEIKPLMLEQVLTQVEDLKNENYCLEDIAILTRDNGSASEVASFLLAHGIPVISSESLLLNSSSEVRFIINFLHFNAQPDNREIQLNILSYLLNKDDLINSLIDVYNHKDNNVLASYITDSEYVFDFNLFKYYSLYEQVEYIITVFNLEPRLNIFLQFFLDKVQDYVVKYDNSISNFVDWWERKSGNFSVVVPEGVQAVNIMTIHKSKGLEFPIVIYPFATSEINTRGNRIWIDEFQDLGAALVSMKKELVGTDYNETYEAELQRKQLDLMNMLYVALTRPKERLYIITKEATSNQLAIYDLFKSYCEQFDSNKIDDATYRFGVFQSPVNRDQEEKAKDELFDLAGYNNWRNRIEISLQAPKVWNVDDPKTFTDYGIIAHKILAEIETIDDIDKVVARNISEGNIDHQEGMEFKSLMNDLFTNVEIKSLFENVSKVKNEQTILLPSGDSYKPDRVVEKDGSTIVVDYKTGSKEKKHIQQINNYKQLLLDMGNSNVKACLLYLKKRELIFC